MSGAWTPGLWTVSAMTPCRVDTGDGSISIMWTDNRDGQHREKRAEANARLIAAAPELFEALRLAEAALAHIGDADREEGDGVAWCEKRAAEPLAAVRAALAKALGTP